MMRILFLLALICVQVSNAYAGYFQSCPRPLRQLVSKIEGMPEIQPLLKQVRKDGPIKIVMETQFDPNIEAVWDPNRRTIILNPNNRDSEGNLICSIVFELHNALTNKRLNELSTKAHRGQLTKDQYVEAVERVEYENAKKASDILNKGIEEGRFPKSAYWYVFNTFEDHYKIQQLFGHSQWIARQYDTGNNSRQVMPFKGTIYNLEKLNEKDRDDLLKFLSIKNALESSHNHEIVHGNQLYQKEVDRLGKTDDHHQKELFAMIFNQYASNESTIG